MRSFALVTVEPIFAQFAYYTLYYQTLSKVNSGWCLHEVDVMYLFTILYSIQWFFYDSNAVAPTRSIFIQYRIMPQLELTSDVRNVSRKNDDDCACKGDTKWTYVTVNQNDKNVSVPGGHSLPLYNLYGDVPLDKV